MPAQHYASVVPVAVRADQHDVVDSSHQSATNTMCDSYQAVHRPEDSRPPVKANTVVVAATTSAKSAYRALAHTADNAKNGSPFDSPHSSCNAQSTSNAPSPTLPSAQPRSLPQSQHSRLSFSSSAPRSFSPIIHPEPDKRGNLEYKLRILPVSASRFSRLVTQLKWRLAEGGGLAVYEIGVLDDGTLVGLSREEMRSSLAQLALMGKALGADCEIRRCMLVEREASGEDESSTGVATSFDHRAEKSDQKPILAGEHRDTSSQTPPPWLSSQLSDYRHRSQASSKNQSAGLDNIVGLRALNNAAAAQLLGTGCDAGSSDPTHGWRFEISESDSEGGDDGELLRRDSLCSGSSGEAGAGSSPEAEEDGFAFSLSLSDHEAPTQQAAAPAVPNVPGRSAAAAKIPRQSRSISNSPWQVRTPEYSPSNGAVRGHASPSKLASTSSSPLVPSPLRASGSPERTTSDATGLGSVNGHARPAKPTTDLSELEGMDVEGVLQFSLVDPRFATNGSGSSYASKTKRKSGRRRMAQWDVQANGAHGGGPATKGDDAEATHVDSCWAQSWHINANAADEEESPEARARAAREAQARKSSKPPRRHAQRPRHERTARRIAELKAREREGQGLLLALEPGYTGNDVGEIKAAVLDQALSQEEERAKWWRYSGLTLEGELPHYDITRQAWVREVADWLTVQEVRDLAETWAPVKKARAIQLDSKNCFEQPGSGPIHATVHRSSAEAPSSSETSYTSAVAGELDALDAEAQTSTVALTRKALNRRKRKARKKALAEAERASAHQAALAASRASPPSSAVNIPASNREEAGHRAPASNGNGWFKSVGSSLEWDSSEAGGTEVGQSLEDDGSSEYPEDSFSMGLTLNIDEVCPLPVAPAQSAQLDAGSGDTRLPSHDSPTLAAPTQANGTNGHVSATSGAAGEPQTGREVKGDGMRLEQVHIDEGEMAREEGVRIIVEAVLSLPPLAASHQW